jgi:glycosyltransferase involved in cell wall biosynthesis
MRTRASAYAKTLFGHIASHAAAVIAVSEFTKNDFLNAFPAARAERVFVTHEAASAAFRHSPDPAKINAFRRKFSLEKPFVLFVGTLKPHKNPLVLLEAVKRLRGRGLDHELVVVGKEDPKRPEVFKALKAEPFARLIGALGDEDLLWAYHAADIFVLPSLREGFGLPLLEAMACGCPVLGSDRASIPEIVGDAGFTFDPDRVDALSELLYNVLRDNELRKKMSLMGIERAKSFSWRKLAEDTLRVYGKALA